MIRRKENRERGSLERDWPLGGQTKFHDGRLLEIGLDFVNLITVLSKICNGFSHRNFSPPLNWISLNSTRLNSEQNWNEEENFYF